MPEDKLYVRADEPRHVVRVLARKDGRVRFQVVEPIVEDGYRQLNTWAFTTLYFPDDRPSRVDRPNEFYGSKDDWVAYANYLESISDR